MNRLTKKNNGTGSWTQLGDKYLPAHNIKHKQCVNKLGQLEDIEEELGIELITLIKALREGVCVVDDDGYIYEDYIKTIDYWQGSWTFISNEQDVEVRLEDYGVTWSLNIEELELKEEE